MIQRHYIDILRGKYRKQRQSFISGVKLSTVFVARNYRKMTSGRQVETAYAGFHINRSLAVETADRNTSTSLKKKVTVI